MACARRDPLDPLRLVDISLPETFGLTQEELRNHAIELYQDGWSIEMITTVLAVQPVTVGANR